MRALLRRSNIEMERKLIVGNLEMDADGMTAMINGEEIPVTTREFNILYKLLSYPKKTFTRAQPVSYTHLDVYKRQQSGDGGPDRADRP